MMILSQMMILIQMKILNRNHQMEIIQKLQKYFLENIQMEKEKKEKNIITKEN